MGVHEPDNLLYYYQTLVAGIFAIVAAVGTVWATIWSAKREIAASKELTAIAQEQTKAGKRQFELEGPFLHPVIKSSTISEGLKWFSIYDHPTSNIPPVASETSFTIRNVGRTPALLVSVAAKLDHWTQMVDEPRVDFLARYDMEPVLEPGGETKQAFTETVTIPIDRAAYQSLKSGNSHLFLYGEIAFSDLLGEDYVQSFCFAYISNAKQFVRYAGRYNKRALASRAKGEAAGKADVGAVGAARRDWSRRAAGGRASGCGKRRAAGVSERNGGGRGHQRCDRGAIGR